MVFQVLIKVTQVSFQSLENPFAMECKIWTTTSKILVSRISKERLHSYYLLLPYYIQKLQLHFAKLNVDIQVSLDDSNQSSNITSQSDQRYLGPLHAKTREIVVCWPRGTCLCQFLLSLKQPVFQKSLLCTSVPLCGMNNILW